LLPPDVRFQSYNAPNSISARAPPQTPLGELTALHRPLAGLKGPTSKGRKGGRMGEKEGKEVEKGGEGREREGKG